MYDTQYTLFIINHIVYCMISLRRFCEECQKRSALESYVPALSRVKSINWFLRVQITHRDRQK